MLAQDESQNISENIQWGFRRKLENSDVSIRILWGMAVWMAKLIVIVSEQAEIVRMIFDLYLKGLTFGQIKTYMESMGVRTITGKD